MPESLMDGFKCPRNDKNDARNRDHRSCGNRIRRLESVGSGPGAAPGISAETPACQLSLSLDRSLSKSTRPTPPEECQKCLWPTWRILLCDERTPIASGFSGCFFRYPNFLAGICRPFGRGVMVKLWSGHLVEEFVSGRLFQSLHDFSIHHLCWTLPYGYELYYTKNIK